MTAPERVRPGTAEQLARLSHFRRLDLPQVDELHVVADFLIGDVGGAQNAAQLLDELADDCTRLWHLITADWDDRDCDELTDEDWMRHSFATQQQEIDHRHELTVARLTSEIERAVWHARYRVSHHARTAGAA